MFETRARDDGGYVPTKFFNERGQSILLPREAARRIAEEKGKARQAEKRELEDKGRRDTGDVEAVGDGEGAPLQSDALTGPMRQIFDLVAFSGVIEMRGKSDRERREQLQGWEKLMRRHRGRRAVRQFPQRLDSLRERFPNFARVVDAIEALVAVSSDLEHGLVVEPLLMVGAPGVGKTLFVEALAEAVGVNMASIPLGAAQGGFQVVGTSTHWSNSSPGQVWKLLASGDFANGVLLLDEIDKMSGDSRYSTESSLLDLLDPRTAKRFEDQAVDIAFDASALWKLATANELGTLSKPIKSRFEIVEIKPPTACELAEIYRRQWLAHCEGHQSAPELSRAVLEKMASERISPREASRRLRFTLGAAIRDRLGRVDALFEIAGGSKKGARIGFVTD